MQVEGWGGHWAAAGKLLHRHGVANSLRGGAASTRAEQIAERQCRQEGRRGTTVETEGGACEQGSVQKAAACAQPAAGATQGLAPGALASASLTISRKEAAMLRA